MNNGNEPINPTPYINQDGTIQHDVYLGLTKREYFASLNLKAILSNSSLINMQFGVGNFLRDDVAVEYAVRMADDLLNYLENPKQ